MELTGVTIFDNKTSGTGLFSNGAGILTLNGGPVTITNSTISGNHASGDGGGIYHDWGSLLLTNVTVAENAADADGDGAGTGGGIFVNDNSDAYLEMHNTLVAENYRGTGSLADQIVGTVDSVSSHNLVVGSGAARLGPLAGNGGPTLTHALLGGSIAIDAGDNDKVPAGVLTDQRGDGFSRIAWQPRRCRGV